MQIEKVIPTSDELVGALDALDVPFLTGGVRDDIARALTPDELFEGLAQSPEARVRSAIIPLLLRHPESADTARLAASHLHGQAQYTLELFYTAAMLLQKIYATRLEQLFGAQPKLPDWFSQDLEIELSDNIQESLAHVGERNAELNGLQMNWTGGYEHAARTWLEYMELRAEWKKERKWQMT